MNPDARTFRKSCLPVSCILRYEHVLYIIITYVGRYTLVRLLSKKLLRTSLKTMMLTCLKIYVFVAQNSEEALSLKDYSNICTNCFDSRFSTIFHRGEKADDRCQQRIINVNANNVSSVKNYILNHHGLPKTRVLLSHL